VHSALLAVQQRMRVGDVAFIGRGDVHAAHQPRVGVDADVRLHAEVVLLALSLTVSQEKFYACPAAARALPETGDQ
jgi:hypothetical protein